MKTILTTTTLLYVLALSVYAQSGSINNTLGTGGSFTIKDGSTTFFTLSQSIGTITLPYGAAGTRNGSIFKGTDSFIHTYFGTGTDGYNTFVGIASGNHTLGGSGAQGSYNTAVGTTSLMSLSTGRQNSAFGAGSLQTNSSGSSNSAFGNSSLLLNTTGNSNSAFGSGALFYATGNNNTAVGALSGRDVLDGSNNITIGYDAQVALGSASNQVRIGNTAISYAGIQVAWSITSDRRAKANINDCRLGLDFIGRLRPVSYVRINDEQQRTEYGFVAQEIEQVLQDAGIKEAGMLTVDDDGRYELRYNDLLAPMVKAIQELKSENDALKKEITRMHSTIAKQVKEEIRSVLLNAVRDKERIVEASLQADE